MECKKRPEIEYPCEWSYKVIGVDKERVRDAAETVMSNRQYLLQYSKSSKSGKYHSWTINLVVESQEERDSLFMALKTHQDVKLVI